MNILSKIGRKSGQDTTLDRVDQETGSLISELDEPQNPEGEDPEAEDGATLETKIDFAEAPGHMEPEDRGDDVDISLKKAQETLQFRQEAQTLRDRSQAVFAQSESVMEEAIRSAEAVAKAYGAGLAADSADILEAVIKARKMAVTLRSRLNKSETDYQDALRHALGSKEMATKDWVAALDTSDFNITNVERELEESARADSIADSLAESARKELLAVQAMWKELASRRPEPLARPTSEATRYLPIDTPETIVQVDQASTTAVAAHRVFLQESSSESDAQVAENTAVAESESLIESIDGFPAVRVPEPANNTPVQPEFSSGGLASTYSGRVYLMFDASLTREGLESVWDAVEEAAGSGVIVDTRLISQDDGVQVTLDLDQTTLDVAAFLRRLSGAEIVPIAEDRLKVAWPGAGIGINQTLASSRSVSRHVPA